MYIDNPQLFSGSLSGSIILDQAFLEDNLIPNADATIDLGSPSQRYRAIHAATITASLSASSIDNFSTEVSRSAAAEGFGGGGGGSYILTNADISGLQVGIVSGSLGGLVDTGSIQNFDSHVSASAAASGFGAGGGGSYTLTNSDIQGLEAGIVSSSGDVAALRAGIFSGSLGGLVDTGSIQNFDSHVSSSAAASGFGSGGSGGGGGISSAFTYNPHQSYIIETGSDYSVAVEVISDMDNIVNWNRNGEDLGITSSIVHNLTAADDFVYVRRMGDSDGVRLNVKSVEDATHFTATSASNSGLSSGTSGSWSPAVGATVGVTAGEVETISFEPPSYNSNSVKLIAVQVYGDFTGGVDVNILVPTGSLGLGYPGFNNFTWPSVRGGGWDGNNFNAQESFNPIRVHRGDVDGNVATNTSFDVLNVITGNIFGPGAFSVTFG